ncbi:serine hydrolase [candidate division KSB1 bacterium]|nr:serine hydrolase [candidate division KSB1 bacterium]
MKRLKVITMAVVFLVICVFGSYPANAQTITAKEVDKLVERTMETFEVPGIAVAIVKDGSVIHAKGYGLRSLNSKKKVNKNTLFGIASNSKAFTTAALGILIDEDKLKWDDKVIDYIPEFRLYNSYVTEEFTIRDLLTHRSGLGLGAGDLMIFPDSSNFTIADVIHNLRYLKSVSSFRSKFDYDNLLYIVAGEIISRISGLSWEEFVEERIMKPLGMDGSAGNFDRVKDKSNIADAHALIEKKIKVVDRYDLQITSAAGGIYSSVQDLSLWVIMQLDSGKYGENRAAQLFSEKVHKEMWSPQTILPVRSGGQYNTHFRAYGLGWGLSDIKGYKQVSHTGGLPGMVTQVTLLPELKLGIIVLTNQQSGAAFASITNQIKDSCLGITGTDRIKENYERVKSRKESAKKITTKVWNEITAQQKDEISEEVDLELYLGTYKDNWFGEVVISKKNDKLWFYSKRSPKLTGELLFYKGNTFIVKWKDRSLDADAFVLFELDYSGKTSGIKMKAISPLTDFSYDFHDLEFFKEED